VANLYTYGGGGGDRASFFMHGPSRLRGAAVALMVFQQSKFINVNSEQISGAFLLL
jgi:hypothetical protein